MNKEAKGAKKSKTIQWLIANEYVFAENEDTDRDLRFQFLDLLKDANAKLLKGKMSKILDIEHKLGLSSRYNQLDLYHSKLLELSAVKNNNLWLYLTVCPRETIDFKSFKTTIERFVKRKMFNSYFYCFEQRGQTIASSGKGVHSHLLLKRDLKYKPSKIILNSKNSFKKITQVSNPKIFFYRWCPIAYLTDKVNYILGQKTGDGKAQKCKIDKHFRKQNDLKLFYGTPPI